MLLTKYIQFNMRKRLTCIPCVARSGGTSLMSTYSLPHQPHLDLTLQSRYPL